jgi:protease IV
MRQAIALCSLLLAATTAGCEGRSRTTTAGAPAHEEHHSGPSVAVLDLSGGVPEQPATGLLGLATKGPSFDGLVREIERLGRGKDLRGVLVRLGAARFGLARATEIGDMLASLGAKVPVYCHADDLGNGTLYVVARGCKRAWLAPAGGVDAVGLAAQTIYFHKLLSEELGLDVDFLQIGKYKGAEEPFTRDGPSPEARDSLQTTLAGMRAAWLHGIAASRPSMASEAPEDGPYDASDARVRGIVDEVGYFDDARDKLESDTGAVRAEVRFGGGASEGGGDEVSDLLRAVAGGSLGSAPVALVRADGAISLEGGAGGMFADGGGIEERSLSRVLSRLERDDEVKVVILRIDSPGGSALASDLLWHELMRLRASKPLVISIGGMAASGGYYMASTGSAILADETSIVGSIGVVGGKVAAERALERFGVHAETIAAKPGEAAAARAAFESPFMPWDDATRERMRATMTGIYELFLARVAEGRNIPVERVAASAEGRIFSGREGLARGLVDEIGGLTEAIAKARSLAGLPADARVATIEESSGWLERLSGDDPPGNASVTRPAGLVASGLSSIAAELEPFVASVTPLVDRERVLCALPFALTVE